MFPSFKWSKKSMFVYLVHVWLKPSCVIFAIQIENVLCDAQFKCFHCKLQLSGGACDQACSAKTKHLQKRESVLCGHF